MAKDDKKKRVLDIADYLFGNPDKDRADVLSEYGKKWQLSERTLDRILREAKEYNLNRLNQQEKIKADMLAAETKEAVKSGYLTRTRAAEILTMIAEGKARQLVIENSNAKKIEIVIPTDKDRIAAIHTLSRMEGWEAVKKLGLSVDEGKQTASFKLSDGSIVDV